MKYLKYFLFLIPLLIIGYVVYVPFIELYKDVDSLVKGLNDDNRRRLEFQKKLPFYNEDSSMYITKDSIITYPHRRKK
jgi:hypothetical protein